MKGALGEGVLPGVLRELYVGRKTGVLRFTQGAARRNVRFVKGSIVHAASEAPEEHLGEVLVRLGRLTRADVDRAGAAVEREHKRLGAVLMELGVFDKDQLEDALALHAHEILLRIFEASSEGAYEFEPAESEVAQGEFTLKLSTGEIILDAVRRVRDPDVVRYALGDIDRVLALSTDPLLRFQRITLSPSDGYILSRIDGTLSAREVMQMLSLPAEDVQRSLFGLLCTGIVEHAAGPPKTPQKAAPIRRPAPRPESPRPAPAPASAPATAGPAAPPPPGSAAAPPAAREPSAETQAKRREIVEAYETLKAKTHFEALGVERTATDAQVKEAYFRLAKKFHPDTHHDADMADLRDKLESVFIRLGEAYEVLRNPRSRGAYEGELASRSPRPAAADARAAAPAAAPPPAVPALDPAVAAQSARRAEKLMEQEKYWDAIQLLEPAVPVLEGKPKQRARLALARAYTRNPNWVHQAEETLHEVVKDDPKNVEAYLALGQLYKSGGLRSRSVSMFRKALELKPENEQAQAELAALGPEPETTESRGFLKKLFGRG